MTVFSARWLHLREPLDAVSRSGALVRFLGEVLGRRTSEAGLSPLQVIDLAAGTGSNFRYMAPILGGLQNWVLLDNDTTLLNAAQQRTQAWAADRAAQFARDSVNIRVTAETFDCRITPKRMDLTQPVDRWHSAAASVVTASALLDLVSENWLTELAHACCESSSCVFFALTFNGRISCEPADSLDKEVFELFRRHQRIDKGFGPALGPDAGSRAIEVFAARGYELHCETSDWILRDEHRAIQLSLLDDWYSAAKAFAANRSGEWDAWRDRRRGYIIDGRSECAVGHMDLIGIAPRYQGQGRA